MAAPWEERENHHKKKDKKIAVDNFNSPPQERDGNKNGSQDFVFQPRVRNRPSEKHHNQRCPDDRKENSEKAVDGKEVATEHKYQA